MMRIGVAGLGAVSPAGWGVTAMANAVGLDQPVASHELKRPGWDTSMPVRTVPAPHPRPPFLNHMRLRRSSPISHFAVGAAMEALGADAQRSHENGFRLGAVLCVMTGCVGYSRRFYEEVWKEPSLASPMLFPETVFNAPSSHLATMLGTHSINYTLVGDAGTFIQGIALAANWLADDRVDGCLVVGAEEIDWLPSEALRLFDGHAMLAEGAGAVYLKPLMNGTTHGVELKGVTDSHLYLQTQSRAAAAKRMRGELPAEAPNHLLCDSLSGANVPDQAERAAWGQWSGPRLSPKRILGDSLAASSAWQCVLAIDALQRGQCNSASVSVVGPNQQAIGAHFRVA